MQVRRQKQEMQVPVGAKVCSPALAIVDDLWREPDGTFTVMLRFPGVKTADEALMSIGGLGAVRVSSGEPVAKNEVLGFAGRAGKVDAQAVAITYTGGPPSLTPVVASVGASVVGAVASLFGRRPAGRTIRR